MSYRDPDREIKLLRALLKIDRPMLTCEIAQVVEFPQNTARVLWLDGMITRGPRGRGWTLTDAGKAYARELAVTP